MYVKGPSKCIASFHSGLLHKTLLLPIGRCYHTTLRPFPFQRPLPPQRARWLISSIMPKRKSLSNASQGPATTTVPIPPPVIDYDPIHPAKRRASQRKVSQPATNTWSTNPDKNANVLDAPGALRASPDADEMDECMDLAEAGMDVDNQIKEEDESPLSEIEETKSAAKPKRTFSNGNAAKNGKPKPQVESYKMVATSTKPKKEAINVKEPQFLDPEAEGDEEADEEDIQAALSRPVPVHSDYLPLPWKGRLGYVST